MEIVEMLKQREELDEGGFEKHQKEYLTLVTEESKDFIKNKLKTSISTGDKKEMTRLSNLEKIHKELDEKKKKLLEKIE